jgi:hypothetical protein
MDPNAFLQLGVWNALLSCLHSTTVAPTAFNFPECKKACPRNVRQHRKRYYFSPLPQQSYLCLLIIQWVTVATAQTGCI